MNAHSLFLASSRPARQAVLPVPARSLTSVQAVMARSWCRIEQARFSRLQTGWDAHGLQACRLFLSVLLEHGHRRSCLHCLWRLPCYSGRAEWLRQAHNIHYWPRKFANPWLKKHTQVCFSPMLHIHLQLAGYPLRIVLSQAPKLVSPPISRSLSKSSPMVSLTSRGQESTILPGPLYTVRTGSRRWTAPPPPACERSKRR